MKPATMVLMKRASRVAHLIGTTIDENEEFTSAEFLDLDVAVADLRQLINDAHNIEFGV